MEPKRVLIDYHPLTRVTSTSQRDLLDGLPRRRSRLQAELEGPRLRSKVLSVKCVLDYKYGLLIWAPAGLSFFAWCSKRGPRVLTWYIESL